MDKQFTYAALLRDRDRGPRLLDEALELFATRPVAAAMSHLVTGLDQLRGRSSGAEWASIRTAWMHHPVARIVHQDPLTSWSYRKPRGYPGDARLLDFIYGEKSVAADLSGASALGRKVYGFTSQSAAANAIRERRRIVAELVDCVAEERGRDIAVLSIAAGHLREAARSTALAEGRIGRWIALDHDARNLAYIRNTLPGSAIEPVGGSVTGILANRHQLGTFDFVSAAGLYDYLAERTARGLTEAMFRMLRPGGVLLFTNFARGIEDAGYMETFMDWPLRFRDANEMAALAAELPDREVARRQVFADSNGKIIYAIVQKT